MKITLYKYHSNFGNSFFENELNNEIYDKVTFEVEPETEKYKIEHCKDGFYRCYYDLLEGGKNYDKNIRNQWRLVSFVHADYGEKIRIKLPLDNGNFITVKTTNTQWGRR